MRLSDRFTEITKQNGLYNIQAIENIPSIMQRGLLSNERARKIDHISIAMNEVQKRRERIQIPNGLALHQYANLYFDPHNPMLSKKRDQNENICILKIDSVVLDFEGVVLSDRNASSDYAAFYPADAGLENINFGLVYARFWNIGNYFEQCIRRSIKCAEVLVPDVIPYDYVACAAVINEKASCKLKAIGFDRNILIEPNIFF